MFQKMWTIFTFSIACVVLQKQWTGQALVKAGTVSATLARHVINNGSTGVCRAYFN